MSIKKYHLFSFVFIFVMGTFLHFAYDLSGHNMLVSYFSPINESPWEHLKVLFFPVAVLFVPEIFICGIKRKDFWAVKMTAVVFAMGFILTFFYTYSGILGFNLLVLDILDFVLGDILYCLVSYKMLIGADEGDKADSLKGITVLLIITASFILWTHNPPDLGIFWG